ncbi:MAG TPA: hypothetical protein VGF08_12790, partial [Terriglobales bacterium]
SNDQPPQFVRIDGGPKPLIIRIVPEALITGRVVIPGADGSNPIEVEIYRRQVRSGKAHWESAGVAKARSNGVFRFAELPAGEYKMLTHEVLDFDPVTFDPQGQAYGFPPVFFPAAKDFVSAGTLNLSAGQMIDVNLTPVRQAYHAVKIPVINLEPGMPLNVSVSVQGRRGPGYSLGYNEREGRIEGLLPDGEYLVEARSYGPKSSAGAVGLTVNGGPAEGAVMALVSNPSIAVELAEQFTSDPETTVASIDGMPGGRRRRGDYLQVILEPAGDFGSGEGRSLRPPGTDDDSLAIDSVPPGRYWLHIETSRGYVASATSRGTDLLREALVVGMGGSPDPITITMRDDGAELDGTLEGFPAGQSEEAAAAPPIQSPPSTYIYCVPLPDTSGQLRESWLTPQGTFTIQELPPGAYRLLAFSRPRPDLEYRNPDAMQQYDSKGQVVRVVAGQTEHVQLRMITDGDLGQ